MSTLFADILNNTQGNGDTPSQNPLVLFLQQEDDVEAFRIWAQHFQNNAAIQKLPIRQWLAQLGLWLSARVMAVSAPM